MVVEGTRRETYFELSSTILLETLAQVPSDGRAGGSTKVQGSQRTNGISLTEKVREW